jgi:hypothetical protein
MQSWRFWAWPALLLAGAALLLLFRPPNALRHAPVSAAAGLPSPAGARAAKGPPAAPAPEEPSQLAAGLNAPSGDVRADLRIVDGIFAAYRSALRGGNPIGENAEITAALTGRNKLGFAFIPPGHPAINDKGELCDRWGTPFFFHQMSGEKLEVRSAGPDRLLWTADDVVFPP